MNMRILFLITWLACASITVFASELEDSRVRCGKMGQQFSDRFKKEYVTDSTHWGNPEFHYSEPLGTCLVYTEVIEGMFNSKESAIWYYRRITDVYSNTVLAYSRYIVYGDDPAKKEKLVNLNNVGDAVNFPSEKFTATKRNLFSH